MPDPETGGPSWDTCARCGYTRHSHHGTKCCESFVEEATPPSLVGAAAGAIPLPLTVRLRQPGAGESYTIEHDGFSGNVVGSYITREGKRGVVLQQIGTRVCHLYGEKWLSPITKEAAEAATKRAGEREKVYVVLSKYFPKDVTFDSLWQELKEAGLVCGVHGGGR
jgi:hypothetical protein